MYFNLIPLLRKKLAALVLHVGTNNSSNETSFQIYDKLLNLVDFIKENNLNCHVMLSSPIDRLDDGKSGLTIKRLNSLLSESSLDIIDSNIGHSCFLGIHGLHLNWHGVGKLALNFVKRIRSILNSGSVKQKLKEVHSRISSFCRSSDNPRSDKPETIFAVSHNLNEKSRNCKKDLAFPISKNSNFSAKENTNVESKSKNESEMQDQPQKCENFTDFLFNIRKKHSNKIIMAHININSLRNKFDMLTNSVTEYIDILMISETKLDNTFPYALYHLKDFSNPYRLDRNCHCGGILVYVRDNILYNLVKLDQNFDNFEGFFIELELSKKNKLLLSYSYNPHKGNTKQHLSNISKGLGELNSKYHNILIIGDLNSAMSEPSLDEFCQTYNLVSTVNKPTCLKNPKNPSCIDLMLNNKQERFLKVKTIETGLSDFHKMMVSVFKKAAKSKSRR